MRYLKIIVSIAMAIIMISCSTNSTLITPQGDTGSIVDSSLSGNTSSETASQNILAAVTAPFVPVPKIWPGYRECPPNDPDKYATINETRELCRRLLAALWPHRDKLTTDLPEGHYVARITKGADRGLWGDPDGGSSWHVFAYMPMYIEGMRHSDPVSTAFCLKGIRMVYSLDFLKNPNATNYKARTYDPIKHRFPAFDPADELDGFFYHGMMTKPGPNDEDYYTNFDLMEYFKIPKTPTRPPHDYAKDNAYN